MESEGKWIKAVSPSEKKLKEFLSSERSSELCEIFLRPSVQSAIKITLQHYMHRYVKKYSYDDAFNEACIGACEAIRSWIGAKDLGGKVDKVETWASRGVRYRLGQVHQPQLVHQTKHRNSKVYNNNISESDSDDECGMGIEQTYCSFSEEAVTETLDVIDVVSMLGVYDPTGISGKIVRIKLDNPELSFDDIGRISSIFKKPVTKQHTNKLFRNSMTWLSKVLGNPKKRNRRTFC